MLVTGILICGKLICLRKSLEAGGRGVESTVVSNTNPDKTVIKTQELTFNHQSIPVIGTVLSGQSRGHSKEGRISVSETRNQKAASKEQYLTQ